MANAGVCNRLQVQLMRFCSKDAVEKCRYNPKKSDIPTAAGDPYVFACLYRIMKTAKTDADKVGESTYSISFVLF